jgi:hypothetical protein
MEPKGRDHAARAVKTEAENRLWLIMKRKKHAHALMTSLILIKRAYVLNLLRICIRELFRLKQ